MLEDANSTQHDSQEIGGLGGSLAGMQRELFAHALRLSRCEVQAQDLVQDTVERALRFEARFERGTNLRAWAHQILANLFITRCRRRRRETRALECLSTDPCAWTAGTPDRTGWRDLSQSTKRALDSLPPMFRSTVLLVDIDEMSYRAAAERLGVPIGTVMSRLHRGRRLLADALREGVEQREAA